MLEKSYGVFTNKPTVLVYGFYHKSNIGDDLFVLAFKHLFPDFDFIFTDKITNEQLDRVSAVFFGGGSFLHDSPEMESGHGLLNKLFSKKIFYIGIGIEDEINAVHLSLMSSAKLIATRSLDQVDRIKIINSNTIYIPDIVYSLQELCSLSEFKSKSVLIIPNISVVPQWNDAHWKHTSWAYFKSEFAQFLDILIENGYKLNFFAMSMNDRLNDHWAISDIVSHMKYRNHYTIGCTQDIEPIVNLFSRYQAVITQRFHGIVLSNMAQVPCLTIHHHDKLKTINTVTGQSVSYYQSSKNELLSRFENVIKIKSDELKIINANNFECLIQQVYNLI